MSPFWTLKFLSYQYDSAPEDPTIPSIPCYMPDRDIPVPVLLSYQYDAPEEPTIPFYMPDRDTSVPMIVRAQESFVSPHLPLFPSSSPPRTPFLSPHPPTLQLLSYQYGAPADPTIPSIPCYMPDRDIPVPVIVRAQVPFVSPFATPRKWTAIFRFVASPHKHVLLDTRSRIIQGPPPLAPLTLPSSSAHPPAVDMANTISGLIASMQGAWQEGAWQEGAWHEGAWQEGAWHEGAWQEGAWHEGAWHEGAWQEGASHEGTWQEGASHEGAWQEGASHEGSQGRHETQGACSQRASKGLASPLSSSPLLSNFILSSFLLSSFLLFSPPLSSPLLSSPLLSSPLLSSPLLSSPLLSSPHLSSLLPGSQGGHGTGAAKADMAPGWDLFLKSKEITDQVWHQLTHTHLPSAYPPSSPCTSGSQGGHGTGAAKADMAPGWDLFPKSEERTHQD
ncbi:unnamed protein product [Closterium sp. Naga37s-1]|nr:unnamed protein product [Closterium sp. Naga37s-1]